jgi:hypothetical protein
MKNYLSILTRRTAVITPQHEPIPGAVPNSAGGYAFPVDDWARLDRFLVLGSEGGSYYAVEAVLTRDNAAAVLRAIAADGERAVARIVAASEGGRAPKNDPALFAVAPVAAAEDLGTRRAALAALPRVARTGTLVGATSCMFFIARAIMSRCCFLMRDRTGAATPIQSTYGDEPRSGASNWGHHVKCWSQAFFA